MTAQPASGAGAFEKFLLWLATDRDLALKRYDEIRKKIVKFFVRKGCADPEEMFAETRDRVTKIIGAGGEYPNADALFYSVANNVWRESLRNPKFEPLPPDPPIPAIPNNETKELEAHCLDTCLTRLPDGERDLISLYYQGKGRNKIEARKRLAADHGGENTLRIKTFRIRSRLRACMDHCMNQTGVN